MKPRQEIVPVHVSHSNQSNNPNSQSKPKVAFQMSHSEKNLTFRVYNGIDKYILYTLLKGLSE